MLHNELTLIDEIWVDPILSGPTNPQGSERKKEIRARQEKMTPKKNKSFRN